MVTFAAAIADSQHVERRSPLFVIPCGARILVLKRKAERDSSSPRAPRNDHWESYSANRDERKREEPRWVTK